MTRRLRITSQATEASRTWLWAVLVIVACAPIVFAQPVERSVFLQRVYGVGEEPQGIAAGDFDGNGWLDLVTASYGAPYMSVLFSRGDGTFVPELRVPTDLGHTDVVAADFNGDQLDDFAARWSDGVNVWLSTGNRTFAEETFYSVPGPSTPDSLDIADFDLDGAPDIACSGNRLTVLRNNGDGVFTIVDLPAGGGARFILAGDFGGDPRADLLDGDRVWVTGGSLSEPIFTPVVSPVLGSDAVAFDFNGDGYLDVAAVSSGSSTVGVHRGLGDGTFEPVVSYPVPLVGRKVTLASLNADDWPDLVVSATVETSPIPQGSPPAVLVSNGDGTFAGAVSYFAPLFGGSMATGDFSGDGRDDVAFAPLYGFAVSPQEKASSAEPISLVFVMEGNGKGGFVTERVPRYDVGDTPVGVVAEDFDGDGKLDLAVANGGSDDVLVLRGQGDGSFDGLGSVSVGAAPSSLTVGLFDSGTTPDVAVANQVSDDVSILLGNGDGTFAVAPFIPVGAAPTAIVQADFDGNGVPDVATANRGSNDVSVALGLGDGTFSTPVFVGVGMEPVAIIAVDLDGLGGLDLVAANQGSNDLSILFGQGDGTFQVEVRHPTQGALIRALQSADVNGDGREDVVIVSYGGPQLEILPGDGAGGFSEHIAMCLATSAVDLVILDLDGDGRKDIVATHDSASVMSVVFGTDSGYSAPQMFATEAEGRIASGDLDGDGLLDIVVASFVGQLPDQLAVHLNQVPVLIRFQADKTTLTWPRLVGTEAYGIYRGDIADLEDADTDGLPDAGYGACQNDSDPDNSDTTFVDEQIPEPGRGLYYLMSRLRMGVEIGMGTTSAGLERVPTRSCFSPQ